MKKTAACLTLAFFAMQSTLAPLAQAAELEGVRNGEPDNQSNQHSQTTAATPAGAQAHEESGITETTEKHGDTVSSQGGETLEEATGVTEAATVAGDESAALAAGMGDDLVSARTTDENTAQPITTGSVEIVLYSGFAKIARTAQLNAELIPAAGGASSKASFAIDESVSGDSYGTFTAELTGLAAGNYTLRITGKGYGGYEQKLSVGMQDRVSLLLVDNDLNALATSENSAYGMVAYGDFDGNGAVNDADAKALVEHLDDTTFAAGDLNGNGVVSLDDVQEFAATLAALNQGTHEAKPAVQKDTSSMKIDGETSEVAEGSDPVENLLDPKVDNALVQLVPKVDAAISEDNPVTLAIDAGGTEMGALTVRPPAASQNRPTRGTVSVETADGETIEVSYAATGARARFARALANESGATATVDTDGSIVINLGTKIAVKRVVIKVTSASGDAKLADIAKVEFLNGTEDRIPAPQLSVPSALAGTPGDKEFTLSWAPQLNVTGYEVEISQGGRTEVVPAAVASATISSFGGKKLVNATTYQVRVRSVNGSWNSGWSEAVSVTPQATKAPDKPDNLVVTGAYRSLNISWKAAEDALTYSVYYRKKGEEDWTLATEGLTKTSYAVGSLESEQEYEVYVTASNEIGTSPASLIASAKTQSINVKVPWYNLINRTVQNPADTSLVSHIENVTTDSVAANQYPEGTTYDPKWVVDGNYETYFHSSSYAQFRGATVTFDQEYEMSSVAITTRLDGNYGNNSGVQITVEDAQGNKKFYGSRTADGGNIQVTGVSGAPNTFMATFPTSKVKKITVKFARYSADPVTISELAFYKHDDLMDKVNALWSDTMHTVLKPEVTQDTITALRTQADQRDPQSASSSNPQGEYSTKRDLALSELANAEAVLQNKQLAEPVQVDATVSSAYDSHVGSAGLNAWQPLGVTAKAGESLIVYVGGEGKTAGSNSELRLVATQYHAESNAWSKTVVETLKVGVNEVTIPDITSLSGERGGALYVEYKGSNKNARYAVRVSGGTKTPVLDLHAIQDATKRQEAAEAYVKELDTYVASLSQKHADGMHEGAYDEKECIDNATDIVTRYLMHSVPATQVEKGLGSGSVAERAKRLVAAADAADQMMTLFYQHKGLTAGITTNADAYGNKNAAPTSRQNIRYMRMFSGAFMYAGGKHIGIEWDQTTNLVNVPGVVTDENGKYQSGSLFGWGIAHEVGHEINQSQYTVAEVTNNYFSQLATKSITGSDRWSYEDVYNKVTSGAKGASSNVFTQLALYWQLHLAFDDGYDFKTYTDYKELFSNVFFARVDTYARNTSLAPAPGEVKLTLNGNTDNNLMRLACAAAQKNMLAFFEAWGMTPDDATRAYAEQFPKEERAIQYMNDDAWSYRVEAKGASVASKVTTKTELTRAENSPEVKLSITSTGGAPSFLRSLFGNAQNGILGFEIRRNGEVVGFAPADEQGNATYTDTIATVNNRVFTYEVVPVDKLLVYGKAEVLSPVKVSHDGSMSKDGWVASTNLVSADDPTTGDEQDPCEPPASQAIDKAIDGKADTVFTGSLPQGSKDSAQITLAFDDVYAVAGLKYRVGSAGTGSDAQAIKDYEIQVSQDGTSWETVKKGTFEPNEQGIATVYFNKLDDEGKTDPRLYVYDASYVRVVAPGQQNIAVGELDVLGPTGDDIDLLTNGIGILKTAVPLDDAGTTIPEGSLVFTGTYKGNPAFNVVKLYDQDNKLVVGANGEAGQIIFADVPEHGELGEVSDGIWVYYITPDNLPQTLPTSVHAELLRVDDAQTLEGERVTADALPVTVPGKTSDELPKIEIVRKAANAKENE